jgi:hypothetical protein
LVRREREREGGEGLREGWRVREREREGEEEDEGEGENERWQRRPRACVCAHKNGLNIVCSLVCVQSRVCAVSCLAQPCVRLATRPRTHSSTCMCNTRREGGSTGRGRERGRERAREVERGRERMHPP